MDYDKCVYCPTPKFGNYSVYQKNGNDFKLRKEESEITSDTWIIGTSDIPPQSFTIAPEHVKSSEWIFMNGSKVFSTIAILTVLSDGDLLTNHGIEPLEALIQINDLAMQLHETDSCISVILKYCRANGLPTFQLLGDEQWKNPHIGFCVNDLISNLESMSEWWESSNRISPSERRENYLDLRKNAPHELMCVDLRLELVYRDYWPRMRRVCSNRIHAAKLGIFFSSLETAEKPVCECQQCHILFLRERKNQNYCKLCGRKSEQQARWRKNKAYKNVLENGGADNGGKTR